MTDHTVHYHCTAISCLQNGTTLPYSDNGRCDLSPLLLFVCVSCTSERHRHCLTVTMVGVICHLCCCLSVPFFRTARHCLTVTMVGVICHLCCCLSVPFRTARHCLTVTMVGVICHLCCCLSVYRVLQNGTHCLTVTMVGVICHLCCCLSVYPCTSERHDIALQ